MFTTNGNNLLKQYSFICVRSASYVDTHSSSLSLSLYADRTNPLLSLSHHRTAVRRHSEAISPSTRSLGRGVAQVFISLISMRQLGIMISRFDPASPVLEFCLLLGFPIENTSVARGCFLFSSLGIPCCV